MSIKNFVLQDINRVYSKNGCFRNIYRFLVIPYFKIITLFRFIEYLEMHNHKLLGGGISLIYLKKCGKYNCEIPKGICMGSGIFFPHNFPVVINCGTKIGENVIIHPNVLIGGSRNKEGRPEIGNNVFLGNGCKIVGNCKIGNWCFVSPGAMVTKNIPDGSTVGYGLNNIIGANGKEMVMYYLTEKQRISSIVVETKH